MLKLRSAITTLLAVVLMLWGGDVWADDEVPDALDPNALVTPEGNGALKTRAGDLKFDNGQPIEWFGFAGRDAYVIRPANGVEEQRRWVWIAPSWLGVWYDPQPSNRTLDEKVNYDYYIEELLKSGFHVVGTDVGTSLGSPQSAAVFQAFYELVQEKYNLNAKARLTGESNGGLIVYAWAFRHPELVDRIYGSQPSLDLRAWPGLDLVVGPKSIGDPEYGFGDITREQLEQMLPEVNPIDNLKPLADAGVKILHVHGEIDGTVPCEPNTVEAQKRYRSLGGEMEIVILPGIGHGPGTGFYNSEKVLEFLRDD
jgi:pimeloyl-ACP methyl ester carboxylesterase